jgi:hypothetical protein
MSLSFGAEDNNAESDDEYVFHHKEQETKDININDNIQKYIDRILSHVQSVIEQQKEIYLENTEVYQAEEIDDELIESIEPFDPIFGVVDVFFHKNAGELDAYIQIQNENIYANGIVKDFPERWIVIRKAVNISTEYSKESIRELFYDDVKNAIIQKKNAHLGAASHVIAGAAAGAAIAGAPVTAAVAVAALGLNAAYQKIYGKKKQLDADVKKAEAQPNITPQEKLVDTDAEELADMVLEIIPQIFENEYNKLKTIEESIDRIQKMLVE